MPIDRIRTRTAEMGENRTVDWRHCFLGWINVIVDFKASKWKVIALTVRDYLPPRISPIKADTDPSSLMAVIT